MTIDVSLTFCSTESADIILEHSLEYDYIVGKHYYCRVPR